MSQFQPASRKQGISKGGVYEIQGPNGEHKTIPTFTCCHCNTIHRVPENQDEIGFCARCHARECLRCAKRLKGRCAPFEDKLKAMELRDRLRRSIGV